MERTEIRSRTFFGVNRSDLVAAFYAGKPMQVLIHQWVKWGPGQTTNLNLRTEEVSMFGYPSKKIKELQERADVAQAKARDALQYAQVLDGSLAKIKSELGPGRDILRADVAFYKNAAKQRDEALQIAQEECKQRGKDIDYLNAELSKANLQILKLKKSARTLMQKAGVKECKPVATPKPGDDPCTCFFCTFGSLKL